MMIATAKSMIQIFIGRNRILKARIPKATRIIPIYVVRLFEARFFLFEFFLLFLLVQYMLLYEYPILSPIQYMKQSTRRCFFVVKTFDII